MFRQLPGHPNLQYLKKQAKELLRGMRQGKLADAQHSLANEYGFATWAKLKSHVQAQGLSPAEAPQGGGVCVTVMQRWFATS